jgi:hypothetical protein
MKAYKHWRDVPGHAWPWLDFSPEEMASRDDGSLLVDARAMDRLQSLRDALGAPMIITSAYRSPAHNARVGGAKGSLHLQGRAFDVSMANHDPALFEAAARKAGFTGFGFYPAQGFMHIDTGPERNWGTPFAPRPSGRFAAEAAPVPLRRDPVVTGGGLAAGAAGLTGGLAAAQAQIEQAHGLFEGFAAQSEALRWVLLACVIGGAALAIWSRLRARRGLGD